MQRISIPLLVAVNFIYALIFKYHRDIALTKMFFCYFLFGQKVTKKAPDFA